MGISPLEIAQLRAFRLSLFVFIAYWLLGFGNNIIYARRRSPVVPYRQIIVLGILRWFFGVKPVTGPIPIFSFVVQVSALLELMIGIAYSLIWPAAQNFDVVLIAILCISMILSLQIAKRIERKQQKDSN